VFCWGVLRGSTYLEASAFDQCAAAGNCSRTPVMIDGLPPVSVVSTSRTHTCGLSTEAKVYCWGLNVWGQLGDGTFTSSSNPVLASSSAKFKTISTAAALTCSLDTNGRAYCWGLSGYPSDSCGKPDVRCSAVPIAIDPVRAYKDLSAQEGGICVIAQDDRIYCLGKGPIVGFPVGTTILSFTRVESPALFTRLSNGPGTCAISSIGFGYCWGSSGSGETGTGRLGTLATPTVIEGPLQPH